jgi:hypothetical protein
LSYLQVYGSSQALLKTYYVRQPIYRLDIANGRCTIPGTYLPDRKTGRLRMSSPGFQKSKRTWQEIAAEAFVEKDPAKLERLADELVQALDERDKILCQKSA